MQVRYLHRHITKMGYDYRMNSEPDNKSQAQILPIDEPVVEKQITQAERLTTECASDLSLITEDPDALTVLILHASVGSGHRSAALSIGQAFELYNKMLNEGVEIEGEGAESIPEHVAGRKVNIKVLDILDFGRIVFDGDNTASMFTGATRPFYDLTWRYTFTGRFLWAGGTIWARIMYPKFVEYISNVKPDAIICTHITAANVAVSARMITRQNFPIVCVPTDYEVEGLWPHLNTDLFCVADEHMAETLRPRRVQDKRIKVTGIPTKPDFAGNYDKLEARRSHGIPEDKRVVLFLAGAKLPRPYVHFRKSTDELIPYLHALPDMHFVIIAGSDVDYASHVRQIVADHGLDNVSVFEYVNDMPQLMSASDLIVCKPGGLTVTECLNSEVPMVLLGKAYGQEKANVLMLTAAGAAFHVTTTRELLDILHQVNEHPAITNALLLNASIIRRPNAAVDIMLATLHVIGGDPAIDNKVRHRHFMHFYWGKKPAHTR